MLILREPVGALLDDDTIGCERLQNRVGSGRPLPMRFRGSVEGSSLRRDADFDLRDIGLLDMAPIAVARNVGLISCAEAGPAATISRARQQARIGIRLRRGAG
jgi:hypothetical protein